MRHLRLVEWWRTKGVYRDAYWEREAEKTYEIDGAMGQRQKNRLAAERAAATLSYRRAYLELATVIVVIIGALCWTLS